MFTKNIKINKEYDLYYKLLTLLAIVVVIAFSIQLLHKILFPSSLFNTNFKNPSGSENNTLSISKNDDGYSFVAPTPNSFSKIAFTLKSSSPINNDSSVYLAKSFQSLFYPTAEESIDMSGKEVNSLTIEGKAIYIFGNGKKYPIESPIAFESAGYKWENVLAGKTVDLSQYEGGKLFGIRGIHPNGTLFQLSDTGRYFYILNNMKYPASNVNEEMKKKSITASEKGIDLQKMCALRKSIFGRNTYKCVISLEDISKNPGRDYLFFIKKSPDFEINSASVTFLRSITLSNLKLELKEIKNRLISRYLL